MNELKINMFGEFSISTDSVSVGDSDNRSKKPWLLLAYLLHEGESFETADGVF